MPLLNRSFQFQLPLNARETRTNDLSVWVSFSIFFTATLAIVFFCCLLRRAYPVQPILRRMNQVPQSSRPPSTNLFANAIAAVALPVSTARSIRVECNNDNIDEEVCPICLEPINIAPASAAACSHLMHVHCWRSWLCKDSSFSCPVCRTSVLQSFKSSPITLTNHLSQLPTSLNVSGPTTTVSQSPPPTQSHRPRQ